MFFVLFPHFLCRCLLFAFIWSLVSQNTEVMTLKWNVFHLTKNLFLPQFSVIKDTNPTEEFLLNYDIGLFNFFLYCLLLYDSKFKCFIVCLFQIVYRILFMSSRQLCSCSKRRQLPHLQVHPQLPHRQPDLHWLLDPDFSISCTSCLEYHCTIVTHYSTVPNLTQCILHLWPQCLDDDLHQFCLCRCSRILFCHQ